MPATRYLLFVGLSSGVLLLGLGGAARAQAPTLTSLSPAANARVVPRSASVVATFSQPLTAASAAALRVFSSQRGGLRSRSGTALSGRTLSFAPTAYDFRPGETVQYTVTRAAASAAGGPLATARVGQFTAAVGGTGRGTFANTA
uniref:Ig-like domain-containing protein n=1 Tax=Hymenobacter sp. IS2118 TaxID=1505605 RepID=UPI001376C072